MRWFGSAFPHSRPDRRAPSSSVASRLPWALASALSLSLSFAIAGAASGCGADPPPPPLRPEYDLHHPSGSIRARAVAAVAARRDASHVPALIQALDDEDPAVRLSASVTLREMTGHDTGYKPYLPQAERRRHVELWKAYWAGRSTSGAPPVPSVPAPMPAPAVRPGPR